MTTRPRADYLSNQLLTRPSDFLVIWEHFKVIVDLPIMLLIMTSLYVIVSIKPEKESLLKFVEKFDQVTVIVVQERQRN